MRAIFGAIVVLALLRDETCAPSSSDAGSSVISPEAGTTSVCARFYNGWYFESATVSKTGQKPVVNPASGTADFNRNGTFALNYEVAQTPFNAAGKFTLTGDQLRAVDDAGALVFEVTVACSDTTRRLTLTSRAEGSVVEYALVAR